MPNHEDEAQLLLQLKSQLTDGSGHLSNWNLTTDGSPCTWTGVKCSSASFLSNSRSRTVVISLNLSSMNLSDTISTSISGLVGLTSLDLSSNRLSSAVPPAIGNCTSLIQLNLHNNEFQGTIPPDLGKLSMLVACSLYNNNLNGPIPDEVGNMASLMHLILYSNNLSGSLPRYIVEFCIRMSCSLLFLSFLSFV